MHPYLEVALVVSWALLILQPPAPVAVARANQFRRSLAATGLRGQPSTQGTLHARNRQGVALVDRPLKHTAVKADVSGMVARVNVVQEFQNPLAEKIEAVCVFPLPPDAAVDFMTMHVGSRTIESRIKRREEARALYDAAREAGYVASMLDQERPNVFTQSVANVLPGENVWVVISYIQTLKYDGRNYESVFPMVVAPRYIPGTAVGRQAAGWSSDTHLVADASRTTPLVVPPGMRAGHDISLEVAIDSGLPVGNLGSGTHDVDVQWYSSQRATVRLRDEKTIPNKTLRYQSAGQTMQEAVLAHRSTKGGFFTPILQPPARIGPADAAPKELIFCPILQARCRAFPSRRPRKPCCWRATDCIRRTPST